MCINKSRESRRSKRVILTNIKTVSCCGKTLEEFLDIINESRPQSGGKMSRSARHTELESVTSSHRPLHDINRGIKTKIQIYTIGIILASRGSRMSAALPSQTPGTHRIICHINNWLENDDRTFKCHQYQMCKQLIKTTLSVIIVANWLRKDTLKERRYSQCCRGLSLNPPSPVSARGCPRCCWGSCRPAPASSPVQWEPGKVKAFNFLSAKML